jgi:Tol biopolymer transport system component
VVSDGNLEQVRLDTWKEIAVYLDTSVRTVQRWESLEGLPVHRHEHSKSGRVHAFKSEIDAWRKGRKVQLARKDRRLPLALVWSLIAVLLCATVAATALWRTRSRNPQGPPRVIHLTTVRGGKVSPAFSSDGTQVTFAWDGGVPGETDIFVKSIGPGEPRRLTTKGGGASAWSPDGRWIAFLRGGTGNQVAVLIVPPTGGEERTVAKIGNSPTALDISLAWSPDSRWLVVPDMAEAGGPHYLVLISVETGEKRKLTSPSAGVLGDGSPAWSQDGNTVAFARHKDLKTSDLYVQFLTDAYEARGMPLQLTNNARWNDQPAWGPGDRDLIYVSDGEFRRALWRIPVHGSGKPQPLVYVESPASEPAIPRRGGRLAFVRNRAATDMWRAQLSQRAGVPPTREVFASSTKDEHSPEFSPSGDQVAFVSNRSGADEVWFCRSDGTAAFQLTSMGTTAWPQWSPDGRTILFSSERENGAHIYAVSVAGGQPRRLTSGTSHDCMATWSRDGFWIYFASNREDGFQIWRMPALGGTPVRVTRHGGHAAKESPDGALLYYTKEHNGSTSLWRVHVNGGAQVQVAESVLAEAFAPTKAGVYYVTKSGASRRASIAFLDAVRGTTTSLQIPEVLPARGLSISPEGRFLIYSTRPEAETDLMLIEGFR